MQGETWDEKPREMQRTPTNGRTGNQQRQPHTINIHTEERKMANRREAQLILINKTRHRPSK